MHHHASTTGYNDSSTRNYPLSYFYTSETSENRRPNDVKARSNNSGNCSVGPTTTEITAAMIKFYSAERNSHQKYFAINSRRYTCHVLRDEVAQGLAKAGVEHVRAFQLAGIPKQCADDLISLALSRIRHRLEGEEPQPWSE